MSPPTKSELRLIAPVPRFALDANEAAISLSVSRDFFDEHIRPELPAIRRGRKVLFTTAALADWAQRNQAMPL
jgi:hypothetical protein